MLTLTSIKIKIKNKLRMKERNYVCFKLEEAIRSVKKLKQFYQLKAINQKLRIF